ncbi:MAG TPA: ATP-binding protein [Gemmatimonadales bacterium]|nr:ATP-binding protein [Gemmatimonadales bacterium]
MTASSASPGGAAAGAGERADTLALVGRIARLLTTGLRPERTLEAVADLLRTALPARRAAFWLLDPRTRLYRPIPAAGSSLASLGSLDELPPLPPHTLRFPLRDDGARFGLLEVELAPDAVPAADRPPAEVLGVVVDVLGPFLSSVELSEDLAYEVALQSREIDAQRRFTENVIDCLPVGLYVVDREYRILLWNRKRETGTQGLRREDVVGRPVFEVLTRQAPEELRAGFDEVFESGRVAQQELEVPGADGPRFYRLSKIPMRDAEGHISHVITIGEDVTEYHAIQSRILQSEKLAAVGQLAAGVMHEINNPLATISACVAALETRLGDHSPEADAVRREYYEMVDKEVQRCTRIVDGLLDFSRPKGKAKGPVALNAIAEDALFLLKHHHRYKQMTVVTELAPALPAAHGNAEQLIQVLLALMLNALDALDAGGQLTVRTRGGRARGHEVVCEIEDTGAGIPRAEQSKIFEPFYTTKAPGRGTGLGLSICYGIVEDHHGRIEVDSQPGRGSLFRIILPADSGRAAAVQGEG